MSAASPPNKLYYGDNLDVLRRHIASDSVDLVYLDPPFNSARNYNVLFAEQDGSRAAAQIQAFEDTWRWDQSASETFHETVAGGGKVAELLVALRGFLGDNDMLAYLSMMAPRLVELRRVLKDTGSLYLHCDPTASHYLKLLLDAVFGPDRFRSEIVWKRSSAHSDTKQGRKIHGHIHDTILFYTKTDAWTWNPQYTPYDDDYVAQRFANSDARGRYKDADLTAAKPGGDTSYAWHVRRPAGGAWTADLEQESLAPRDGWEYKAITPSSGRFWAYSRENLIGFSAEGKLHYFSTGMPRLKQHVGDLPGIGLQDLWVDISPVNSQAQERLGYPTQKPEALLDRVIATSNNVGDVILDPFCGCGTAIASAQHLNRRWVGIDITHLAVTLIKNRLRGAYGDAARFAVVGEPTTVDDAAELARTDPYQFQWWALGLVDARPAAGKKGADKGIDGRIFFRDGSPKDGTSQVILSVKAGHLQAAHVRDLVGVVQRETAAIGALLSFESPTKNMRAEAASAGYFETPWGKHPKIQLLTVGELLEGRRLDYPQTAGTNRTFKSAPKAKGAAKEAPSLFGDD